PVSGFGPASALTAASPFGAAFLTLARSRGASAAKLRTPPASRATPNFEVAALGALGASVLAGSAALAVSGAFGGGTNPLISQARSPSGVTVTLPAGMRGVSTLVRSALTSAFAGSAFAVSGALEDMRRFSAGCCWDSALPPATFASFGRKETAESLPARPISGLPRSKGLNASDVLAASDAILIGSLLAVAL